MPKPLMVFNETLPAINLASNFVVLQNAYESFQPDWLNFALQYLESFPRDIKTKSLQCINRFQDGKISLIELTETAKNLIGLGTEFSVFDIVIEDGNISFRQKLGYPDLVDILFQEEEWKIAGYGIKNIVDQFFLIQWTQGKLLFPFGIEKPYQRRGRWYDYLPSIEMVDILNERMQHRSDEGKEYNDFRIPTALNILTCTRWLTTADPLDEDISTLETRLNAVTESASNRKWNTASMNEFRLALIDAGRTDITTPRQAGADKHREAMGYDLDAILSFDDVDTLRSPNLAELKNEAKAFLEMLRDDGLKRSTISSTASSLSHIFKYIRQEMPHEKIDQDAVDRMFDPKSKKGFFPYLKGILGDDYAINVIRMTARLFDYTGLLSAFAKKHVPRARTGQRLEPYRNAMPSEMLQHLLDIIKNRPPQTSTRWSRSKADTAWWPHEVYPVFPMMSLFHIFIPLRGAQVRNLCREKSFVFSNEGKIDSFIINTDKNVNREYLQEIPCIWEDLQIFAPFLEWHRQYFPHLQKVDYDDDPNSPWDKIEPLMILPSILKPVSGSTHRIYHKRVLCQYQIEARQLFMEGKLESLPKVAWSNGKNGFPETVEELNKLSDEYINKKITVAYDIHSMRVTGATRYLESGVPLNIVMMLTGHTSPNTLVRVYINMTRKEKIGKLTSAVKKIYFGEKKELLSNVQKLIDTEFDPDNPENMDAVFEQNGLFSPYRKAASVPSKGLQQGTDIARKVHPTAWFPMIHGICPGVKCPDGREKRCSLCPYLITGRLFLEGVQHQANLCMSNFHRESLELRDEKEQNGKGNHARAERLESIMEELQGWWDILQKIDQDLSNPPGQDLPVVISGDTRYIAAKEMQTELAYLENVYDARQLGVEQDRYGLKMLTIMAVKISMQMQEQNVTLSLLNDEDKAIDYLMTYYAGELGDHQLDTFMKQLAQETPQKQIAS